MPDFYKALLEGRPIAKQDLNAVCPGRSVMKSMVFSPSITALLDAFCKIFRTNNNWTWTGAAVTPSPGAILDGDAKTGQCVALAIAFKKLAILAFPNGLGLPEGDLGTASPYYGRHGHGFVSVHRDVDGGNTVLGLPSNIVSVVADPNLYNLPVACQPELYSWDNHKTVPYGGKFYDPSYWNVYNRLEDMVTYHFCAADDNAIKRNLETREGGTRTCLFLPAETDTKQKLYFRIIEDTESKAGRTLTYQGPYAELPGKPI